MMVKFQIELDNGMVVESHDKDWKHIADHVHFLPPNGDKLWRAYTLVTDSGNTVRVDFQTGLFYINNLVIHPATPEGLVLTNREEKQKFNATGPWGFLNGLPYFPVVGRTNIVGYWGSAQIPYCGWKRQVGDRTYEKRCFIYPSEQIVMT